MTTKKKPAKTATARMHDSYVRMLALAKSESLNSGAALARAVGLSHAGITNWRERGMSRAGALQFQDRLGWRAAYLLTGDMPERVQDNQGVAALPPAPAPKPQPQPHATELVPAAPEDKIQMRINPMPDGRALLEIACPNMRSAGGLFDMIRELAKA